MPEQSDALTSPNFEQLKTKLRELFELDKADLDFGIYRILRQRHDEIKDFLDRHLARTVQEALASHTLQSQAQVQDELAKAEDAARGLGMDPAQSPKVKELREKLKGASDTNAVADEVYSHLYTFFSRYYREGDFLGLQRSTVQGREKYMIPYNGEEVKLVWANMDQYYIKSSELLRDYVFHLSTADFASGQLPLGIQPENVKIQFKLVEGDTEKDNIKPDGKTTRAFALDDEKPFEELDDTTLVIRFRYQELATERNLQDKLNADAVRKLSEVLPEKWRAILFANDPTYQSKDKKDTRTILEKHLRGYTAKFQFDYFIHKDLGGFLRRELDFYIKNEVMFLDDIEETTAPKAEEYLSKIRALRRCALPIIRMLAQLEDFQKKLWLKKKFVVETRYCMTLDRVPEELYAEICANEAQWSEWEQLYALSEIPEDMFTAKPCTPEFLKQQPYMILDTRHFSREFMLKLLASLDDLDESLDGVCVRSDNFQALLSMQETFRDEIKTIHIDPPYNTATSGFLYKNNFQHSSWLMMMENRISATRVFLDSDASFICHIDENEFDSLYAILKKQNFNFLGTIIWDKRNPMMGGTGIAVQHEYIFWGSNHEGTFATSSENAKEILEKADQLIHQYGGVTDKCRKDFSSWIRQNEKLSGGEKAYQYLNEDGRVYQSVGMGWPNPNPAPEQFFVPLIHPVTKKPCPVPPKGWSRSPEKMHELLSKNEIIFGENETVQPRRKIFLKPTTNAPLASVLQTGQRGKADLDKMGLDFSYVHPLSVYEELLYGGLLGSGGYVLDFFAGSGTTGHAVINLNRSDKEKRNYILVEMGEHFETVLVPRLKKVVYSTDWKDGKPQTRNTGISHAFKIVRLESYEDTLNNLRLSLTPEQEAALKKSADEQRDEYMLGYFLDVESAGSASLLDVKQFRDPFNYQLQIATSSAGETQPTTVDLVETFNWLIGLKVKHIDSQKGFLTVTGEKRAGGRTLIVWRTLSEDAIADNQALEEFLAKLEINPADTEFEFIYVNGSHTLNDPHNKIHLIEEEFKRRMFESEAFESLT